MFEQTAPNATIYVEDTDFFTMEYSGSRNAFAMTTSSVHATDQGNGNGTQSEA
jgi:hypothetical protein